MSSGERDSDTVSLAFFVFISRQWFREQSIGRAIWNKKLRTVGKRNASHGL